MSTRVAVGVILLGLVGATVDHSAPTAWAEPLKTRASSRESGPDVSDLDVAELALKPEGDWARHLPDLLPAIVACVRRGGPDVTAVATARVSEPGTVAVRLRRLGGQRFDCLAPADGQPAERFSSVPADAPSLPGEGRPLFLPALGPVPETPSGRSRGLQALLDADGSLLGWLVYEDVPPSGDRP